MRRTGAIFYVLACAALANLGWVWLQRHDSTLRMQRRLEARQHHGIPDKSPTGVRITQFYATAGEITDAEHSTVCYGVENARIVRIEPPVANVTTYKLIAEGSDGTQDSASFSLRVKPAPPAILFMAVSHKEIVKGDAVTVCYGVDHANGVRLDPIGWSLFAVRKNCVRLYPPGTMNFTLVASGAAGASVRERFKVKVR